MVVPQIATAAKAVGKGAEGAKKFRKARRIGKKAKPILGKEGKPKFPKVDLGPSTSLFGPEAIIMLPFAMMLDLIGFVLICFLLDDFGLLDIIGTVFIGGWMLMRFGGWSGKPGKKGKKMGRKIMKRLGITLGIELMPWLGGLIPGWTLAVFFELKNNPL